MKICIVTRVDVNHDIGGMQNHARDLARALARRGHDVTILTAAHPSGRKASRRGRIKRIFLESVPWSHYSLKWWLQGRRFFRESRKKEEFDIIISESMACFSLLFPRRVTKAPLVLFCHGTPAGEIKTRIGLGFKKDTFIQVIYNISTYPLYLACLMGAMLTIAISEETRKAVAREFPLIPGNKIVYIPNGVDGKLFFPNRKEVEGTLLCVGRIHEQKGFQDVIKVLPGIAREFPETRLKIAGSGNFEEDLKNLARRLGVEDRVQFLGQKSPGELRDLYNEARAVIVPSRGMEGLPYVVIEAMACGTPVIAARTGGIKSAVREGKEGLLFTPGDRDALTMAIRSILGNLDLARTLGEQGHRRFRERFDSRRIMDLINKILIKIFHEYH